MIFDSHFHIIDPKYPLIPNQDYSPAAFTVKEYQQKIKPYSIHAGALISGSFQGFDQRYLIEALELLGDQFVGVTQLPETVTDQEIQVLNQYRIRAIRFNFYRFELFSIQALARFAKRVYDLVGWHTEIYIDSKNLSEIKTQILSLPAVSIDHLGLSQEGFNTVLSLVEKGVKVKATGFMRVNFEVLPALKKIYQVNPHALLFGTDLPGTRASRQFNRADLNLIQDNFTDVEQNNIFWHNAARFYRIDEQ